MSTINASTYYIFACIVDNPNATSRNLNKAYIAGPIVNQSANCTLEHKLFFFFGK